MVKKSAKSSQSASSADRQTHIYIMAALFLIQNIVDLLNYLAATTYIHTISDEEYRLVVLYLAAGNEILILHLSTGDLREIQQTCNNMAQLGK
jgi:hypothetical protein